MGLADDTKLLTAIGRVAVEFGSLEQALGAAIEMLMRGSREPPKRGDDGHYGDKYGRISSAVVARIPSFVVRAELLEALADIHLEGRDDGAEVMERIREQTAALLALNTERNSVEGRDDGAEVWSHGLWLQSHGPTVRGPIAMRATWRRAKGPPTGSSGEGLNMEVRQFGVKMSMETLTLDETVSNLEKLDQEIAAASSVLYRLEVPGLFEDDDRPDPK